MKASLYALALAALATLLQGYGVDFGLENYAKMAELMRSMKGQAVVSVNDIPEMREAFKGLKMDRLTITYSVGKAASRKPTGELVIHNLR